jgi:hypothetical protein
MSADYQTITIWFPIETAPRDGTLLIGAFPDHPCRLIQWLNPMMKHDGGSWHVHASQEEYTPSPTHWMWLPEPPNHER